MFEVNENLMIAIINYLGERPYKEVAGLIGSIRQLRKVENTPVEQEPEVSKVRKVIPKKEEEVCKDTVPSAKKK